MSPFSTAVFLGVDLGWYGKPSGLASIAINREGLSLRNVTRLEDTDDILRWIKSEAGSGSAVVGVDAPLVIRNRTWWFWATQRNRVYGCGGKGYIVVPERKPSYPAGQRSCAPNLSR